MSTYLGYLSSLVTSMITWAGDVMDFIVDQPLILVFVLLPLVGIGVGLIKRIIR